MASPTPTTPSDDKSQKPSHGKALSPVRYQTLAKLGHNTPRAVALVAALIPSIQLVVTLRPVLGWHAYVGGVSLLFISTCFIFRRPLKLGKSRAFLWLVAVKAALVLVHVAEAVSGHTAHTPVDSVLVALSLDAFSTICYFGLLYLLDHMTETILDQLEHKKHKKWKERTEIKNLGYGKTARYLTYFRPFDSHACLGIFFKIVGQCSNVQIRLLELGTERVVDGYAHLFGSGQVRFYVGSGDYILEMTNLDPDHAIKLMEISMAEIMP